jgi:hypothetical protein
MTRPKSVRQVAKNETRGSGNLHNLWIQVTPKYSLELWWQERGLEVIWHPYEPSASEKAEIKKIVPKQNESGAT